MTSTATRTNQQESEPPQVPSKPPANNRSILILREIEPDSSESSVRDIFNSENCPSKPVHCEYALQNSWYVTFKDDDEASQALAYIRKHIVKWKGKPIMARYKPKPAVPSAVNQPPPPRQSPTVLSQVAILNHTSGGPSPNDVSPATNDGQGAPALTLPYGPYQAPSSAPPHHHHPDGSLIHHPHLTEPHLVGPSSQPPMHQHPMATGYNPYYGQMMQAPWDLSTVFVFNGLSPHNKSSVSSVSLVGGNGGGGGGAYQHHHNV